jgi:hypothetical protein
MKPLTPETKAMLGALFPYLYTDEGYEDCIFCLQNPRITPYAAIFPIITEVVATQDSILIDALTIEIRTRSAWYQWPSDLRSILRKSRVIHYQNRNSLGNYPFPVVSEDEKRKRLSIPMTLMRGWNDHQIWIQLSDGMLNFPIIKSLELLEITLRGILLLNTSKFD